MAPKLMAPKSKVVPKAVAKGKAKGKAKAKASSPAPKARPLRTVATIDDNMLKMKIRMDKLQDQLNDLKTDWRLRVIQLETQAKELRYDHRITSMQGEVNEMYSEWECTNSWIHGMDRPGQSSPEWNLDA